MKLYLTWASIPEFVDLPRDKRKLAWRYAFPKASFHVVPLSLLVFLSVSIGYIQKFVREATESHLWTAVICLPFVAVAGGAFGSYLVHRARPHLRAFLAQESNSSAPAV